MKRMAKAKEKPSDPPVIRKGRPALTPEGRESQLIALAVDRVEQRLLAGTATSQEIIHFLKLGSTREQLEMEKLRKENLLLKAKTEAIESEKKTAELFAEAIAAMKSYRPSEDEES
jgi:hypothetical protein